MSEQTVEAFQDLVSTIESKLNDIKQENPLDRDQLPTSFGSNQKNSNKKRNKNKNKNRGRGRGKGRGKKRRQYHQDFDTSLTATDTSQFKKSVNDFTNNTEKRKWFYQQFIKNYHNLPAHLQTKYDVPVNDNNNNNQDINTVDYGELLMKISANPKLEKPTFKDTCKKNTYYIHNLVTPPVCKKRKLNTETEDDDHEQKLALELVDTAKQRQTVWTYFDQLTSYYYSRYLYYSSLVISKHWNYVDREECIGRINHRQRIYMAEYSDPKELELHLSIKPPDESIPEKYWYQRYRYFSKFDDGIKLDIESWYSVTPEKIAINIAEKCKCNIILDAMCGAGGNSIAFAKYCDLVIAVDIDCNKIKMAKHNAKIYGVENKIQFIVGDFFQIAESFIQKKGLIDIVFLSPPWGGQFYQQKQFDIEYLCDDGKMNGIELFKIAQQITPNIAYFLPKNTNYRQLQSLAVSGQKCQITKNHLYKKVKSITAYYGNLCKKNKKKQKNKNKNKLINENECSLNTSPPSNISSI